MTKSILSIICLVYNHVNYIRDCLDGFVKQKTNFPFEVLINDDCSTDGTADIIREYEKKYPNLFRCVYQTENQWGKKDIWLDILFPMIQGKYVALCDGDDYWIDPLKIQKQVDFLETHLDYSICFHPVTVHWEDQRENDVIIPNESILGKKNDFDLSNLVKQNFIPSNSVVYRWQKDVVTFFPRGVQPGDWCLHLFHAKYGKIKMLSDVMSVYRRNKGGIWTEYYQTKRWFKNFGIPVLRGLVWMEKSFEKDYFFEKEKLFIILTMIYKNKNEKKKEVLSLYRAKNNKRNVFFKFFFYKFIRLFCFTKKMRNFVNKRKRIYVELVELVQKLNKGKR